MNARSIILAIAATAASGFAVVYAAVQILL